MKTKRLAGKTILITGASGGVGTAVARLLAAEGARLVLTDRPGGADRSGSDDISAYVEADLSSGEGLDHLFAEVDRASDRLDVLVACAGVGADPLMAMDEASWRYVVESNLMSYVACTQRAIERIRRHGEGGSVILVGSVSVHIKAVGESVYNAAKGGVAAFALTLRKELMHENIRVTLIEPGAINTAMQPLPAEERARQMNAHLLLPPEAVADAIHYAATRPSGVDIVTLRVEPQIQKIV